jgi:hypothetical protein
LRYEIQEMDFRRKAFNPHNKDTSAIKGYYIFEIFKLSISDSVFYQLQLKSAKYYSPLISTILPPVNICQFRMDKNGNSKMIFSSKSNKFISFRSQKGTDYFIKSLDK